MKKYFDRAVNRFYSEVAVLSYIVAYNAARGYWSWIDEGMGEPTEPSPIDNHRSN